MKDLTDEQLDAIAGSSDYFDGYMAIRAASAADRALNAPADRTYEQEHAIKEGHRNKIEDDYFDARPGFSQVHRVSFRGGFDRGWDAAKKDAPAGRDVIQWASEWIRNSYQDYASIAELCDAMLAAAPTPPAEQGEPWYGHKFKEISRGFWKCECGKTLQEKQCNPHDEDQLMQAALSQPAPLEQQEPAPDVLATLRAEVEAIYNDANYGRWLKNKVLARIDAAIDKMGGKV